MGVTEAIAGEGIDPRVAAFLNDARKKLVDTGTRNRLIHVNRQGRGRFLTIVYERADDVFRILRSEGRRMRFHPLETDPEEVDDDSVRLDEADLSLFSGVGEVDESRFTDRYLDTMLGTDALQKRVLQLARDARTAEEEQGINILFLAIGFLQWFEDERSEVTREAPLLLLPVELIRNERTSTYDLLAREDEILTNLPLQARLRDDFGLSLPEVDVDEEWSPSAYFNLVRDAVSAKPRWDIDDHGMQLGFFSFAKQLMQRDLQQHEWPDGRLGGDATIRSLMVRGFEPEPPLFGRDERLDGRLVPEAIVQVIDADAPQTRVIEEVRSGRNLVVQGPPGTGKSQTITNIIAAAAHDGKTVLFMAEKMAALDVVHSRMKRCGLGELCLELHSRHANKREVLQEIGRTLKSREEVAPQPITAGELRQKRDELNRISDLLHGEVANRGFTAFDAIANVVGFISSGRKPPTLSRKGLAEFTLAQCEQLDRDIGELGRLLKSGGPRGLHPFAGCRELDLTPIQQERLKDGLEQAIEALDAAVIENSSFGVGSQEDGLGAADAEFWAPQPETVADMHRSAAFLKLLSDRPTEGMSLAAAVLGEGIGRQLVESLEVGAAWASAKRDAAPLFREHAWDIPAVELQLDLERGLAEGLRGVFARLGSDYRGASKNLGRLASDELPADATARVELAKRLTDVQRRRRELGDEEGFLKAHLGAQWRGEQTDFGGLQRTARWLSRIEETGLSLSSRGLERATETITDPGGAAAAYRENGEAALVHSGEVVDLLSLDLPALGFGGALENVRLVSLRERFAEMARNLDRYVEWCRIEILVRELSDSSLDELVGMLDAGTLAPTEAVAEFGYACAEARLDLALHMVPGLAILRHVDRHELARVFAALDTKHTEDVRGLIRSRHLAQLPTGAAGEMGVILGEIARKRRHMPIRRLMGRAGRMVQRIKPVFLMSPISIAQFLPPKALRFDLLVVDEASQVKPEDAIGAIARCGQIVIVGDQKQLPPTSFFDRLGAAGELDEEDEDDEGVVAVTEMESILTLCEARGVSARMLEWHYRSRDPSLIRVSNEEFYDSQLILPPSPLTQDGSYGLSFERVPGVYASRGSAGPGRPGTNRIEAEHVVRAVSAHAEDAPELSLGVVTFSKAQADMVTELLEYERRRNEVLNDFLREGHAEDAFVKNIENVQGDERDVIFISVGYGPTVAGGALSSMRFGPINAEGGERRLNVLFTRARARCRVFASFEAGDIDLSRTTRVGPKILRRFLEYAATGQFVKHYTEGLGPDSPFEEDVANVIRSLGYLADHQVGSGGFRIDVGVRHPDSPGRYILAVECDGATYHGALSARERDRHRQEVLEGMLWRFHRIWSTDWFYRRSPEIGRLEEALEKARERAKFMVVPGANEAGRRIDEPESTEVRDTDAQPAELGMRAAPYRSVDVSETRALVRKHASRVRSYNEAHQMPVPRLAEIVRKVVDIEGPIHVDLVARRIAVAFDKGRSGARILAATQAALRHARLQEPSELLEKGQFWLTRIHSGDVPVRDRSGVDGGVGEPRFLPPMEIVAAADWIERECGRVEPDDLLRELARLLGFRRTGTELRRVIGEALERR